MMSNDTEATKPQSESVAIKPVACPHCEYVQEFARPLSGPGVPVKGSISICAGCGNASTFDAMLSLRALSAEEWESMSPGFRATLRDLVARSKVYLATRRSS